MHAINKSLEQIKPIINGGRLIRTTEHIEFSSRQSEATVLFDLECENYLRLLVQGLSIQEIILQYHAQLLRMNFVMLKESLSKLYWHHHLVNGDEFSEFIEASDGLPAYDGLLSDPLADLPIDKTLSPIFVIAPVVLSLLVLKLFRMDGISPFIIFLFPQIFLTAKGGLSGLASRFIFNHPEPMSLHFSIFGVYYKLSAGKRTAIGLVQFHVHLLICMVLSALGFMFFNHSQNPIFMQFGPTLVLLMLIVCLSPVHNTDLSNLRFQMQKMLARRQGLKVQGKGSENLAKFFYLGCILLYNGLAIYFSMRAMLQTMHFIVMKNYLFLIYQIVLDLAAFAVFLDLVDELEQLSGALYWSPRQWSSQVHLSFKKSQQDISKLIRSIAIFEGIPEEVFSQMTKAAKILELKPGSRIFKNGDLSTDLCVVIEGQVGIYRRLDDGKRQKVIDIYDGQIFGEGGFLLSRPRMGSAYALKRTSLLVLKRAEFFNSSNRTQEANMTKFQKKIWGFQALVQSEFFRRLPSEAVMQLLKLGEIVELAQQQIVIQQGDPSDALWVIIQGECQAIVDDRPVRKMGAKDVFGEIGLLWNTSRTSSVVTAVPSIFLKIKAQDVWAFLSHNLSIGIALQELGEHRLG